MRWIPGSLFVIGMALGSVSGRAPEEIEAAVRAAEALIESLDEKQRDALSFPFHDDEQRYRWSNLPQDIFERRGLRMGDLSAEQQQRVHGVLAALLSEAGYEQVVENMRGDEVLLRRGSRMDFGLAAFYLSFLGEPSTESPWTFQFGGHHLAINATVAGDRITLAPSLTGGQPVDFEWEGKTVRLLAEEEDQVYALLASLKEAQRGRAILAERHADLEFGPTARGEIRPSSRGLPGRDMTPEQRAALLALISERVGLLEEAQAQRTLKRIEGDLDDTWFAWYGSPKPGEAASFRIHGPTFVMEYAPQGGNDPTQHIHAMYREPANEYGLGDVEAWESR